MDAAQQLDALRLKEDAIQAKLRLLEDQLFYSRARVESFVYRDLHDGRGEERAAAS